VLAPLLGVKFDAYSASGQQDALNRISKLLDCPANEKGKDKTTATNFSIDYAYNTDLGDDRAYPDSPGFSSSMQSWAFFKKVSSIPQNVLIALDTTDVPKTDAERFESVDELTWKKRIGGGPHTGKANMLFMDGSVRLARAYMAPNGQQLPPDPPTSSTAPPEFTANPKAFTDLEDWMIRYPRPTDSATTIEKSRWKKGRQLPF
jgi:prepilin-type processing-associated H-X9-DG protein